MFPAVFLILSAIALRLITGFAIVSGSTWLSNISPFAAIALCSAAYLPTRYKFALPLFAIVASDLLLNLHYGVSLFASATLIHDFAFLLVGCLGWLLQGRTSLKTLLPASIVGSLLFYGFTNAAAWITDPGYAKNFAGLLQSLTVGLSAYGSTPSWMFFRNSVVSDLIFTALFVACMSFGRNSQRATLREPVAGTA